MYDKVRFFYPRTRDTPCILQYLEGSKEAVDPNTGEITGKGYLKNLRVHDFSNGISIEGSLSRFYYPNNIYTLQRKTTHNAIEEISDTLHLDLSAAYVTRLEFGTQFPMRHEVGCYFNRLGEMPRFIRCPLAEALYYKTRSKKPSKVFCLYDKRADADAKGMELPKGFEDANLLKYEMRLNGRIAKQVGVYEAKASTLSDVNFYKRMLEIWSDGYFSISKLQQTRRNMKDIRTVGDAFDAFVAHLISQGGQSEIDGYMERLKEAQVFPDRKYYTRVKNKINEVMKKQGEYIPDELIKELDDEVRNASAYF